MPILVVDDLRTFTKLPKDTVYARTVAEAMSVLQNGPVAQLWLDHDLGATEDIRPLVLQIEERAFNGNPFDIGSITVHSSNSYGSSWIVSGLRRYYQVRQVDPKWYL